MSFINIDREHPTRKLGMGRLPGDTKEARRNAFLGLITKLPGIPTYNLPTIESTTLLFGGPMLDKDLLASFGTEIDPLRATDANKPAGCLEVSSTWSATPGEFMKTTLVCGVQWRYDFEPQALTVLGNSWTAPATSTLPPVSPDDITASDTPAVLGLFPGGGEGGLPPDQLIPGTLEWAWWAELGAFYATRGYNLQWQYGPNNMLLNDQLRYTAYTPSNAQEGSASSSDVDVMAFARRTNDYYRNYLNSPRIFLPADRARIGNMTLGAAGQSVMRPSRVYEYPGATYGGVALKQYLRGNNEFRRFTSPFIWPRGLGIGLKAVQTSNIDSAQMRNYYSATQGLGGTTPIAIMTPDVHIPTGFSAPGTGGVTGVEPSLDTVTLLNSERTFNQREVYKGGTWRLTVAVKGLELTPQMVAELDDVAFQDIVRSQCGCACYGIGT